MQVHYLKRIILTAIFPILTILTAGLQSCNDSTVKKKVVYINSYHQGFPPSDQITRGVMENLSRDTFEIYSFFMDTKRNPSEAYITQRAAELLDSINHIQPDVLIVSDDNAMKYLVEPSFQGNDLPIVFCGVNWSADKYDIAECNITGILEILPVRELIQTMRPYEPGLKRLLVLNENTTTSRKTKPILDTLIGNLGLEATQELVDDFESWKSAFIKGNDSADMVYLQTHIEKYIKVPLVTCEEFMMPFAVFGLTQLSEEQGMKAADMAKQIINGTDPADILVTRNTWTKVWLNNHLANRIGFVPDDTLREKANIVDY